MIDKTGLSAHIASSTNLSERARASLDCATEPQRVSASNRAEILNRAADSLVGQLVSVEGRGLQQVKAVDPKRSVLELCNGGLKLDLAQAAFSGAAVAVDERRSYGKIEVVQARDEVPFWRKFGESPLWHGVLNALAGGRNVFPKRRIDIDKLKLEMPTDLRARSDAMRLFTSELAFTSYSSSIEEAARGLEARGFKDVRIIGRDDALVMLAVDPTEKAIVCSFRCATKVHSTLLATDNRPVEEGRLVMPRGIHRYVSRIKEGLDSELDALLKKYPDAELVGTGSSLGGGAALQWLSRRIEEGGLEPDRVAQFVVHGATRGVGRERADELREILGGRIDTCVAKGDWLTKLGGGHAEHAGKISNIGNRQVHPLTSHGLGYTVTSLRKSMRHGPATAEARQAATTAQNQKMVDRYPWMAHILRDPDAFIADTRARFAAQKAKNPDAPYDFEFADQGMCFIEQIRDSVDEKIESCKKELAPLIGRPSRADEVEDRKLGLKFLREIRKELHDTVQSGSLTYRQMVEKAYFASHALSQRDVDGLDRWDQWMLGVDRKIQGQKDVSIAEAYEIYKRREFSVFQKRSSQSSFDSVHEAFEKAFFDPEKMHFIYLPTPKSLGRDIFIRLSLHDIHLGGIATKPIGADGFWRPGYDFWLHDVRHASLTWANRERYKRNNAITEDQMAALRGQFDVWLGDFDKALERLPSRFRKSVIYFMFNYHHERGIVPTPSSFEDDPPRFFSSVREPLSMGNLLFWAQKLGRQAPKFLSLADSQKTFKQAWFWLQDFWLPRRGAEEAVLGGKRVHNPTRPSTSEYATTFELLANPQPYNGEYVRKDAAKSTPAA